ncbi:resolvase [Hyphomicrobium sulfonivorans]|nr:recombinase family protein [Hyphomicrobium sulfonivorans]NSL72459.1 resolvase [Hyphomicrobium sulfonivorans]
MAKQLRVALYARVSTAEQTTANQLAELQAWAKRAGHEVVQVFEDAGISGAKGRDKRPGFDAMLKAATRREFDMLAVWSSDRLGRSMPDLIEVLQMIRGTGLALYIHTQALDTSTPSGRALFQMLGVFAELERELIVARVHAGISRARSAGVKFGRPRKGKTTEAEIRAQLATGTGVIKTARIVGCSTREAHRISLAMRGQG